MKFILIAENKPYALILRGESMTEYAVVYGLDKNLGSWASTGSYYNFGQYAQISKVEALSNALDDFRIRTEPQYISKARLSEIATLLKDGLIEDNEDEAYIFMADTVELSEIEAEYLGLDMEKYREIAGNGDDGEDDAPSSTGGDYGPSNPWDAPGMSVSDFI